MAFTKTSTVLSSNDLAIKHQRRVLPICRKGGDDKEWPRDAGGS